MPVSLVPTENNSVLALSGNITPELFETLSGNTLDGYRESFVDKMAKPANYESKIEKHMIEDHDSEKSFDDYMFHAYVGSLTIVGLFVLFRFIQKS